MEHYKSRDNDFFHFTNPQDDASEVDDDYEDDYDELQYYDVDDDRSCDFNFHPIGITPPPNSQTISMMNNNDTVTTSMAELETFDNGALIFHLDNTMKNLSDKLHHTIEGIGTRISHIENDTFILDKHVEDVKNFEEKYHVNTHSKLRQMQNVLQEVQDGVLFLRDKHEIAETKLHIAKLQSSKRDEVTLSKPPSNEVALSQFTQSYQLNPFQGINSPQSYNFLNHPVQETVQETPKTSSFSSFPIYPCEPARWEEQGLTLTTSRNFQTSRNYETEFHAKYMPEFGNNYGNTHVEQPLPHALPTADYLEDELSSENGNGDKIRVDDIVDKVTAMGFRRDLVRASVRKLIESGSSVDLNTVLDKMMNRK